MMWFNRLGLLLQFIAVFFMAPEIIGVERLRRIQRTVTLGQQLSVYVPLAVGLVLIAWAITFRELAEHLHRTHAAAIVSGIALVVSVGVFQLVRRRVLANFVQELKDQNVLRKRLLGVGASLFTIGFLLQFMATF